MYLVTIAYTINTLHHGVVLPYQPTIYVANNPQKEIDLELNFTSLIEKVGGATMSEM